MKRLSDLAMPVGRRSRLVRARQSVRVWALVTVTLLVGLAGGCSDNQESGPLTFNGDELVLDGQRHDPYFFIAVCAAEDEPAHVTITSVKGRVVEGAEPSSLSFAIAWPDGPEFEAIIGGRQPLPDAYVPAVGAKGTIGTCDESPVSAGLAVAFPHVGEQPVWVRDLIVEYAIDGDDYVGGASVLIGQCPLGQVSTGASPRGRMCRPKAGP